MHGHKQTAQSLITEKVADKHSVGICICITKMETSSET